MIDALIAGRLTSKPSAKTGPSGKQFVTCRLLATAGNGESASVSVICFAPDISAALLALDSGDSVSLSGSLSVKTWATQAGEPRAGLDLVAHAQLTPFHSGRKRKATSKASDHYKREPAGAGLQTAELLYGGEDDL